MISRLGITVMVGIIMVLFLHPTLALASSLTLSPATGTFNKSCNFSLDIILDTQGAQTNGTDTILFYDTSRFTANTISTGSIYSDYPASNIDASAGKISISGLAAVSSTFAGKGTFATVNFTVAADAPVGASQIKFDFDPNNMTKTTDSNVVQTSGGSVTDTLSSVVNGSYTVGSGSCLAGPGSSGGSTTGGGGGAGGSGSGGSASSSGSIKTVDQLVGQKPGSPELTFTIAILGSTLTVLGILGWILL